MQFEADIIAYLQKLSSGFFDYFNLGLTMMGDEIFFILVAVFLYWCIDKRFAFRFANVYFLSVGINEGLKSLFGRIRPYDKYAPYVRSIGAKTGGYSFPSGHSQSIANIGTQFAVEYKQKRRLFIIVGAAAAATVMFTRIYLGQHYLTDTLAGAALGVGVAIGGSFLFGFLKEKEEVLAYFIFPLSVIVAVVLCLINVPAANVLKVAGAYGAFTAGYFIEKRYVRFEVKAIWWKHLIKLLLGIALIFGIKEGFKFLLPENIPFLHSYLRYFLIGLFAALGATAFLKVIRL